MFIWAFICAMTIVYDLSVPWMFSTLLVFWGLCEAVTSQSTTSASFNKQSLSTSTPLNQTNSIIKRHTWGEPRGNLPFSLSLSLCAGLLIFLCLLCFTWLYIFPRSEWDIAKPLPWFDFNKPLTWSCLDNLNSSHARASHLFPRIQWPWSIS